MIIGAFIFVIGMCLLCRSRVWRPRDRAPLPMPDWPARWLATPDGTWLSTTAHCWYSPSGRLVAQGVGELRCAGDGLLWLGSHGSLEIPWDTLLAVRGHTNGVLLHGRGIAPCVLSVGNNDVWHAQLTYWLAHTWDWDGSAWVCRNERTDD